uniref:RanBP2-type domain-containing protein n=1 Tax=viral metagenome TaxID=1070528 RepID=A0A6H1ZAM0_9ZZZZ
MLEYIQRKRTPGFCLPNNTRCCTRGTKWGNWRREGEEYQGVKLSAKGALHLYELELKEKLLRNELCLAELTEYDYLACWCHEDAPACHVRDVLIPLVRLLLNKELNMDELEKRVRQFNSLSLPGQPMGMHIGTSYLVNDLWREVQRLRALKSYPTKDALDNGGGVAVWTCPSCCACNYVTHKNCPLCKTPNPHFANRGAT